MIHLIVGNTGSGKTSYAKELKKKTKGIIFSIDKWNKTLFFPDKEQTDGLDWFLERIERSEAIIQDLIIQLESSSYNSILDLGFSKVSHREKFRTFALENNFEIKMHFLDISKEIRLERIVKRNNEKGDTFEFEVSQENFDFMEKWFEEPNSTEMKNGIHITKN